MLQSLPPAPSAPPAQSQASAPPSGQALLVASARFLGPEKTGQLYSELVRQHMRLLHGNCLALLRALASHNDIPEKSKWPDAMRQIAEAAVSRLDEVGKKQGQNEWLDWRVSEKAPPP